MDQPSESQAVSPEIIKIASPLLLGPVFNWALYGILCVQIYVYSYNFPDDGRPLKCLAYFVFLLETVQTALTGCDVYYWFITGYGNVERLAHSHFAPIDLAIITAVISLVTQGFFCYRIWLLNKKLMWMCYIIIVASVTQAVAATWMGIASLKVGKYVVTNTAMYLWAIPGSLADILIAVAMTLLLRKAGKFSNFVMVRVVRLTIETNAVTAMLAITALVLYAAFPNEVYYIYATVVIGKVYSNTVLVSLNNRIYLRDHISCGRGNAKVFPVTDMSFPTSETPRCSAVPGTYPPASDCESFPVYTISEREDVNSSKSNDTHKNWILPYTGKKCHKLPEDPEWTAGSPPHPYAQPRR